VSRVKKRYLLVLLVVIAVTMLLGCSPTDQELFWFESEEFGQFSTLDLERAQNEVPFMIIVPTYLPDKISEHPSIRGPLLEQWSDRDAYLEMAYLHTGGGLYEGAVLIEEHNRPMRGPDPDLNPGYVYVDITGVEVIETEHNLWPYKLDEGPIDLWGYIYWWNQENIYFKAAVYGYDHSEAIKVVESMIQQMQH